MKTFYQTVMQETEDMTAHQLRMVIACLMSYIQQGRTFDEAKEILMDFVEYEKREAGEAA